MSAGAARLSPCPKLAILRCKNSSLEDALALYNANKVPVKTLQ
jgi:hypothetical protein